MKTRFVIEGTWSGYTSSQQRVVHRTVHKGSRRKLRAWADKTHGIRYTDGTMLYLSVRDAKPRERVKEIHGYDKLIEDCYSHDVYKVADLYADRRCPTCESPRPHLHPAMQHEGEVQPCSDPWHGYTHSSTLPFQRLPKGAA